MPHCHSHGHGHSHAHGHAHAHGAPPSGANDEALKDEEDEKGDGYTQYSKWVEKIFSFLVYSYVYAKAFDNITEDQQNETHLGISAPSLVFGVLLAAFAAWGSAHSHSAFNNKNQGTETNPNLPETSDTCSEAEEKTEETNQDIESQTITASPAAPTGYMARFDAYFGLTGLTKRERRKIAGDYVGHIGELLAPITFVVTLGLGNNTPNAITTASWQVSGLIFSAVCSVAPARTCKNSMLEEKGKTVNTGPDFFTWAGVAGESLCLSLGLAYWIGSTIDSIGNLSPSIFELSTPGFICGAILAAPSAISSLYLHTLTNLNYQTNKQVSATSIANTGLTPFQKAASFFDYGTHIGENTPRISFLGSILASYIPNENTRYGVTIAVQVVAFAIGTPAAHANWRPCPYNARKFNYRNGLFAPKKAIGNEEQDDLTKGLLAANTNSNR